jgi:CRP-like cAMP-binding protein
MGSDSNLARPANRLLATLPNEELDRLRRHLQPTELRTRHHLYEVGDVIDWVYFPDRGVISQLGLMSNGRAVHRAAIGNEGMLDVSVFLTPGRKSSCLTVVQVSGDGLRMPADVFVDLADENAGLQRAMLRLADATLEASAQSAMCNRFHRIGQRTARWILGTYNRMDTDSFGLTQEALASMVGAGRPRVSEAAAELQRGGIITYFRGTITVVDRQRLRNAACDCHDIIQRAFDGVGKPGDPAQPSP